VVFGGRDWRRRAGKGVEEMYLGVRRRTFCFSLHALNWSFLGSVGELHSYCYVDGSFAFIVSCGISSK